MEGFGDQEDRDFLDFIIKGIEAGNPEVGSAALVSDFSSISFNSEPNNEEIQVNDELPSLSHGLDILTNASNNQHLLNSNLWHRSQGFEIGKQNSQISIYDNNMSNINHDITMQLKLPNTHETFNSQVTCLRQENRKAEQAFLLNSKLSDGCHEIHMNASANHLVVNDITANTVHTPDRKRNVSPNRMINHDSQAQKRSRHKICEMRSQVLSLCSEDDGTNYALETYMSATPSQMVFDNSRLSGNHHECSNIKETHFHNQGIQEHCNLSKTIGQNNASNVHIFQSPQNATAPSEIPYSGSIPVDDILAVPGPSGIFQNTKGSNLSGEKFQHISQLEHDSVDVDKEMLLCGFCAKELAEHGVAYQGKNLYECCLCRYKSEVMYDLQMHIRVFLRVYHYYCNVCGEVYTGIGSHDGERKCKPCGKNFLCKGLLEQHSERHEKYYYYHCRLCGTKINEQISKDAKTIVYQCCACDYTNRCKNNLQCHLHTHTDLQLFKCFICSRRFKRRPALRRHFRLMHTIED